MEKVFIDAWNEKSELIEERMRDIANTYASSLYCYIDYGTILHTALKCMFGDENGDCKFGFPDFENIHEIDDGEYQGTLLFVIPEHTYQPRDYWLVKVGYGSCSCCDTLKAVLEEPECEMAKGLKTLAMHMVQSAKAV